MAALPSSSPAAAQHFDSSLPIKAHGKPHSRVAPSNMAEQSAVTTTVIIDGYEVPHLDEWPGLHEVLRGDVHRQSQRLL